MAGDGGGWPPIPGVLVMYPSIPTNFSASFEGREESESRNSEGIGESLILNTCVIFEV
jgi:hypothetical protein